MGRGQPGRARREIAANLDMTERSVYGIVTDLTAAGFVVKQKDDRRNRYQIQARNLAAGHRPSAKF